MFNPLSLVPEVRTERLLTHDDLPLPVDAVEKELRVLKACDGVLVGLPENSPPSFGTGFELGIAYQLEIPVVVWSHELNKHPMLYRRFTQSKDIEKAVSVLVNLMSTRPMRNRQTAMELS